MAGDSGMAPSRRDDSPDRLAADTVRLAVSRAISGSYFLSQAAGMLTPQPSSGLGAPFATDGRTLWYDPECILLDLGRTREPPVRDYVHVLAHCLLLHPFMGGEVAKDPAAWQLACDIAVERIVAEVCGPRPGERGQAQGVVLSRLARDLGEPLTAERVYRALREGGYRASRRSWQRVFRCDNDVVDHQIVSMEMENDVTISFSMDAFTLGDQRETHIRLTHGEIDGDERILRVRRFRGGEEQVYDFSGILGKPFHAGADLNLVEDFVDTISRREHRFRTSIGKSVESHRICFEAERSRLSGQTVILDQTR